MKKSLFSLSFILFAFYLQAQDTLSVKPSDTSGLRADSKIYVVVAVLIAILSGLFYYIIRLDRKISRMEKTDRQP
jgi:CcmD family protein